MKRGVFERSLSDYDETGLHLSISDLFSVITIILGIVKIHTYPGKIAKARNHPQTQAIEVTPFWAWSYFPYGC